ncbi:MAG: hypothetical protein WAM14_04575 [Candidatus Nitrosopolaris sp.]
MKKKQIILCTSITVVLLASIYAIPNALGQQLVPKILQGVSPKNGHGIDSHIIAIYSFIVNCNQINL